MTEALSALLGVFAGSLLSVLLAGRTARAQAVNQRWAERRSEIIEQLASLLKDTRDCMAEARGFETLGRGRSVKLVYSDLEALLPLARLYLSPTLTKAFRPFQKWLYDHYQEQRDTETDQPEEGSLNALMKLLAEAIEGKHGRD